MGDEKTKESRSPNASKTERERGDFLLSFYVQSQFIFTESVQRQVRQVGALSFIGKSKGLWSSLWLLCRFKSTFIRERPFTSAICEVFFFFSTLDNSQKRKKSLFFKSVMAGGAERLPSTPSCPHVPLLLPCVSSSFSQEIDSPCQQEESCWRWFPNISIINQSFSQIQWSLQNFPLNQLPVRIHEVLGAEFAVASCRSCPCFWFYVLSNTPS